MSKRPCVTCKAPRPPRRRRYCSDKCANRHYKQQQRRRESDLAVRFELSGDDQLAVAFAWGVPCDPDVRDMLYEDARPRSIRRCQGLL